MTREQLRLRYMAAIGRHWRTSLDRSGPTPALLDELANIADDHAAATVKAAVIAQAQPPVLVAASSTGTGGGGGGFDSRPLVVDEGKRESRTVGDATEPPKPSPPRTRTRTRKGEPA